jgi:hypothetical protein
MATKENEFTETFNQIKDQPAADGSEGEKKKGLAAVSLEPYRNDIGISQNQEWIKAETDRFQDEQRFLRNLRQYRGIYDPEVRAKINPNRSSAYIRLTRTKVKTYDARMMDIKFPANDDKDWSIQPTPVPELNPEILKQFAEQIFVHTGQVPTEEDVKAIVVKFADDQAGNMEREINDQLQEFDYRATIRDVVHSGHLYGTGVLKGPLVKEVVSKRWHLVNNEYKQITLKRIIPTAQFVPIWDIYPDKSAKVLKDARYVWQKHLFSKNRLHKLSRRQDFNGKAIRAYMEAFPQGNAEYKHYEEHLRDMSTTNKKDGESSFPKIEKYEVHEKWGYLDIEDAKTLMPKVKQETWDAMDAVEVACNIWLIDDIVIKAVISPIEGAELPYYFYYFDKDETSIFGDGIPEIMRDPQQLYNAGVRAMLDNAAISAGPIIEANVDVLADGEDPTSLFPFRVFQRIGQGTDASTQAIRVNTMPSYTNEFLNLIEFFQGTADESTTIPRALSGLPDNNATGAQKTATGMSMLIGASNITLKDQVHYFDEGITNKFIKSMYFWNMEFNEKNNIKGDFNIVARGSKSLIAKEVKMEQINQFLALTNNEIDLQYIKRDVLLRELAEIFDLDKLGFIRTEDEVQANQKQQQEAAKRQQDAALILEAMQAESSGHVPNAVQKTMQLFNIQMPGGAANVDTSQIQEKQLG